MTHKKNFVFHPLLFALYPILDLYVNMEASLPFRMALRALIVAPLTALVLLLGIRWRVKDWDRAGLLTTVALFLLLFYGIIYRAVGLALDKFHAGQHLILFPLWLALMAFLSSRWVWKNLSNHSMVTKFLNFAALTALILSGSRYGLKQFSGQPVDAQVFMAAEQRWQQEADFPLTGAAPDIYYIILDGYGRADVLEDLYDLDNTPFLDALKARGFYVAENSSTNYIQTALSLSSSLNFAYLNDLALPTDSADRDAIAYLITHNRLRTLLETRGYQLITADSGYEFTMIADAEVIFKPPAATRPQSNAFEELVLVSSAGVLLVDTGIVKLPSIGHDYPRLRTQSAFEYLAEAATLPGPKFVFFHIVAPHPPFLFDRDGNPTAPEMAYGNSDGSHFLGSTAQYLAGYREQLLYINTQTLRALDAVLAHSATPPIIIVQGDHGPGAYLSWESAEASCLQERLGILNAYYFPDGDYDRLYPEITPVNSFRVVLNTYFGAELALLADHTYYTTWTRPYDFLDVTTAGQLPCEIP